MIWTVIIEQNGSIDKSKWYMWKKNRRDERKCVIKKWIAMRITLFTWQYTYHLNIPASPAFISLEIKKIKYLLAPHTIHYLQPVKYWRLCEILMESTWRQESIKETRLANNYLILKPRQYCYFRVLRNFNFNFLNPPTIYDQFLRWLVRQRLRVNLRLTMLGSLQCRLTF